MSNEPLIRNISDTAAWVAMYRAVESERHDAVFRDPYARRLAGKRGADLLGISQWSNKHAWSYVARTYLFDTYIERELQAGADMILNLAAGLDARPYRMDLPRSLQWVEVDLPDLLTYKDEVMRNEKPRCLLRRVPLDLSNVAARKTLFDELGRKAKRALVVSEGLIIYLTADEVCDLGRDLAGQPSFQRWATDLVSPALLKMLQKQIGTPLNEAGAPLKFGPEEGTAFFTRCGWTPLEARSMLHTGARLKRLPLFMRLFALFPDSQGRGSGRRPWGGVVLLGKASAA